MFKAFIAHTLYIFLFTLLLPLLPLRLLWRSRRAPAYRARLLERFGIVKIKPSINGIWVHAVSVGEVMAAETTVRALQKKYPNKSITVTTTTPTGSERVQALFGDSVCHVYAPYDWPLFVWFFLRRVRPDILIIMETELWPITIGLSRLFGIAVLVANARLSVKSAVGYQKIQWLVAVMLKDIWIAAQHKTDGNRFLNLGANAERLSVTGSVKFDVQVSSRLREQAEALKVSFNNAGERFIWIAASTHEGEDEIVLAAHAKIIEENPSALLLLVPRHPERFDTVASLVSERGMSLVRRSQWAGLGENNNKTLESAQICLIDSMGELMLFYGVSSLAFIGGSLVPVGGHNYLEAASWGLKILSGPHRHNFSHIAAMLVEANAMEIVSDVDELAMTVKLSMQDPSVCQRAGKEAVKLLESNRGAGEKLLTFIDKIDRRVDA